MSKYVIFDVDGTLNQTALYAVPAYLSELEKRGIQKSREDIVHCIGMAPHDIAMTLLGDIDKETEMKWRNDVKEAESKMIIGNAKSFPRMKDVLQSLHEKGYRTAICSNAYPHHINEVLHNIGLENLFDTIASLEMGKNKASVLSSLLSKIKPEKACLVGDRRFDIEASRVNNIPVIGCLYGYAPEEVKEATYTVNEPIEILDVVEKIFK
ncbi:MAG: HAD family hydrolase [Lachnospiraceae bacterium]|jgi:phosphoglycolate phosphatase|nr:HAD family hydrolase [Lachnospiraceae bacterium]